MSTLEKTIDLLHELSEKEIEAIYRYFQFIYHQEEPNSSLLSETNLAKDWLLDEEESAWKLLIKQR